MFYVYGTYPRTQDASGKWCFFFSGCPTGNWNNLYCWWLESWLESIWCICNASQKQVTSLGVVHPCSFLKIIRPEPKLKAANKGITFVELNILRGASWMIEKIVFIRGISKLMNTTFTQPKCIGTCCPDKILVSTRDFADWQFQLFLGDENQLWNPVKGGPGSNYKWDLP